MNFKTFYLLIITIVFFACKNDSKSIKNEVQRKDVSLKNNVAEEQIQTYIRHSEEDETILAEVVYQNNNQITKLEGDLFFQGGLMETKSLGQIKPLFYKAERSEKSPNRFDFSCKKSQESAFNWSITPKYIDKIVKISAASKKNSLSFELVGLPLEENESLVFLLTDKNGETATGTIEANQIKENKVTIAGQLFSNLENGAATLNIVRKTSVSKVENNKELLISVEYYTKPYITTIKN